jgi:hypothetical protein
VSAVNTVATIAGWSFTLLVLLVVGFQVALVAGAPWGHLTQGGAHVGTLPPAGRAIAAASALVLVGIGAVVLIGAGIALPHLRAAVRPWMWAAVAFSGLSVVANAATTSVAERTLWLPVAILLLVASLVVALRSP